MTTTLEKIREQRAKQEAGLGVFVVLLQRVYQGEVDSVLVDAWKSREAAEAAARAYKAENPGRHIYYVVSWVELMDRD